MSGLYDAVMQPLASMKSAKRVADQQNVLLLKGAHCRFSLSCFGISSRAFIA